MSVAAVLLPLFALVAILFAALLRPGRTAQATDALDGRALGLALLFFTLTTLALFTRKADLIFLILAWIFVVARLVATFPALGGTALSGRRAVDLAGGLVLALMWVLFALAVLLNV